MERARKSTGLPTERWLVSWRCPPLSSHVDWKEQMMTEKHIVWSQLESEAMQRERTSDNKGGHSSTSHPPKKKTQKPPNFFCKLISIKEEIALSMWMEQINLWQNVWALFTKWLWEFNLQHGLDMDNLLPAHNGHRCALTTGKVGAIWGCGDESWGMSEALLQDIWIQVQQLLSAPSAAIPRTRAWVDEKNRPWRW